MKKLVLVVIFLSTLGAGCTADSGYVSGTPVPGAFVHFDRQG